MTLTATNEAVVLAAPLAGTVKDQYGDPCPAATTGSYPLRAVCATCHGRVRCQDGSAAWVHVNCSGQARCYPRVRP
jgi:hypothetical protein